MESLGMTLNQWRASAGLLSRALIDLACLVGLPIMCLGFVKLLLLVVKHLRLYVFSQFHCCRPESLRHRYGRWAVVTGATDGIGLELAKELARRGQHIAIIGRSDDKMASVKANLERLASDIQVLCIKSDLSDSRPKNFENIRSQLDPDNRDIGLLINNAGNAPEEFSCFHKFDDQEQVGIINLNVLALTQLTKMVLPGMLRRNRGCIVQVSSQYAHIPGPYVGLYAPSKSCVDAFSRALRIEYSSTPIDIINWNPGPVETKLVTRVTGDKRAAWITISPQYYARTALNALSTRIGFYNGTFYHELYDWVCNALAPLGLMDAAIKHFIKKMMARAMHDLSPY